MLSVKTGKESVNYDGSHKNEWPQKGTKGTKKERICTSQMKAHPLQHAYEHANRVRVKFNLPGGVHAPPGTRHATRNTGRGLGTMIHWFLRPFVRFADWRFGTKLTGCAACARRQAKLDRWSARVFRKLSLVRKRWEGRDEARRI